MLATPGGGGGAVRVILRLRPPSPAEIAANSAVVVAALAHAPPPPGVPPDAPHAAAPTPLAVLAAALGRGAGGVTVVLAARRAGGSRLHGRGAHAVRAATLPELRVRLDGAVLPAALTGARGNDQELIFAAARDTIAAVAFRGRSGTVFAYGPTGAQCAARARRVRGKSCSHPSPSFTPRARRAQALARLTR